MGDTARGVAKAQCTPASMRPRKPSGPPPPPPPPQPKSKTESQTQEQTPAPSQTLESQSINGAEASQPSYGSFETALKASLPEPKPATPVASPNSNGGTTTKRYPEATNSETDIAQDISDDNMPRKASASSAASARVSRTASAEKSRKTSRVRLRHKSSARATITLDQLLDALGPLALINHGHQSADAEAKGKATALLTYASSTMAASMLRDASSDELGRAWLTVRPLAFCHDHDVRILLLRFLRSMMLSLEHVSALFQNAADLAIVRAIERDHKKFKSERLMGFKIARQLCLCVCAASAQRPPVYLDSILRSVVAVSYARGDPCRKVALETLCLLSVGVPRQPYHHQVHSVDSIARCGGYRAITEAIVDPVIGASVARPLTLILVALCNAERTRALLQPNVLIAAILSPMTDGDSASKTASTRDHQLKRIGCSRIALATMLQTWAGLIMLSCLPHGLRSVVQMLVQPVPVIVRLEMLRAVSQVFVSLSSYQTAPDFERADAKVAARAVSARDPSASTSQGNLRHDTAWGAGPGSAGARDLAATGLGLNVHRSGSLLRQFFASLLLAFAHCGLIEALKELSRSSHTEIAHIATHLLGFFLRHTSTLFPSTIHQRVVALEDSVCAAAKVSAASDVAGDNASRAAAHQAAKSLGA